MKFDVGVIYDGGRVVISVDVPVKAPFHARAVEFHYDLVAHVAGEDRGEMEEHQRFPLAPVLFGERAPVFDAVLDALDLARDDLGAVRAAEEFRFVLAVPAA